MNLEELYLHIVFNSEYFENLKVFFNNIGIKCKKINKLCVYLCNESIEAIDGQNYQLFKTFTELKHLSLNFGNDLTIKSLKNCKQLTHLSLSFRFKLKDIFTDIHLYLPQLTHLYCNTKYNCHLTDDHLKPLTKLKHLKCLIIKPKHLSICTEKGICDIINNCPEIRSIRFDRKPKITETTINALISLAEKKPFCHFIHSFGIKPYYSKEGFDYLKFLTKKKYTNLPKNLDIIPFNVKIFSIHGSNDN